MGDESKGTPDPGKTVATPDAGKNVTPEQVTDIVAKAVAAALAPFQQSFEKVTATVNGLAADKRRGAETKGDDKGEKKGDDNAELVTMREKLQQMENRDKESRKKLALKDALDAAGDTITGRNFLERLIATELDFDSTGNVVAVVEGRHVPLADRVKAYAADPQWQKPSGTNGAGKPDGSKNSNSGSSKKIQIKRNDLEAKAQYRQQILKGEVEFVD